MKIKHNSSPQAVPAATPATQAKPGKLVAFVSRVIGLIAVAFTFAMFVQVVPLLLVFTGGILGIAADSPVQSVDGVIWILTSISLLIPLVYFLIQWVKYLCVRFVVRPGPLPLFPSDMKKHS